MELITKLLTVFGLSLVKLWAAIPAGLTLGLNPLVTGIIAAAGTMTSVLIVVALGDALRKRLLHKKEGILSGHVYNIWCRYGVVGLCLLAPLFGAPFGTALGITLGAPKGRLLLWMGIGILIWSAGLTLAGSLGVVNFEALVHGAGELF